MSKLNSNHGFVSLLYSVADDPLRLWSKHVSAEQGRVRRIEDEFLNGDKVIEIRGADNSPIITNISCPASPLDCLNIRLPILVVIVRNLRARFRIDLQLIDEEGIRRRFFVATYETSKNRAGAMVEYDTARVPLMLEADWNQLEIDLRSWCRLAFHTEYRALQRLIVYQNCRLRRIYLQDRHYEESEASIDMCQAFFDMYMLKWGINFVERACQADETGAEAKIGKTLERVSSAQTSTSKNPPVAKEIHQEKSSNAKKSSPVKVKAQLGSRSDSAKVNATNRRLTSGDAKTPRTETSKKQKVTAVVKKEETPKVKVKVKSANSGENQPSNGDEREGRIFRQWPYNHAKVHRASEMTFKLVSADKKSTVGATGKFTNLFKIQERPFFKGNVPSLPINEISPEVEKLAAKAKSDDIGARTNAKLLTTDEAVDRYLELRHVIDRIILENFRTRGFTTINEVELSIYNPKNRRNSYGQDKLVEGRRTSLEKACGTECAIEEKQKSNCLDKQSDK